MPSSALGSEDSRLATTKKSWTMFLPAGQYRGKPEPSRDGQNHEQYKRFLERVDRAFVLRAAGQPDVKGSIVLSFFSGRADQLREIRLVMAPDDTPGWLQGLPTPFIR